MRSRTPAAGNHQPQTTACSMIEQTNSMTLKSDETRTAHSLLRTWPEATVTYSFSNIRTPAACAGHSARCEASSTGWHPRTTAPLFGRAQVCRGKGIFGNEHMEVAGQLRAAICPAPNCDAADLHALQINHGGRARRHAYTILRREAVIQK